MSDISGIVSAVSATVALASFVLAVMAFRRTSRMQDADYRPHIAFDNDELSDFLQCDDELAAVLTVAIAAHYWNDADARRECRPSEEVSGQSLQ